MAKRRGNLPFEFPDLGASKKGYSLLIKGLPGTGKTSLALELTSHLPHAFYISTRINPDVIISDSPWILEEFPENRKYPYFVDATGTSSVSSPNYANLSFETMPEFVQQLYAIGSDLGQKVIIIDSWNALISNLSKNQRNHWESAIVQYFRAENSTIIFAMEGDQESSLDWIVDGIVVLSKKSVVSEHGIPRRIRELSFHKMRGIEIGNEAYLATLYQGRMKTFDPFKYRFPAIILKSNTIPDSDDDHLSSGSLSFDELLGGGLQKGSWNLFEISTTIGDALDIISYPLLTNHLNNHRPAITIFREGVTIDSKKQYLDVFTGSEKWIDQTVNFERYASEKTNNRVELPDTIEELIDILESSKDKLRSKFEGVFLISLGLDVLENKYGIPSLNKFIAIIVSKARVEGNVVVGWLKEQQDFRGGTTAATTHWKIDLINRALVLEGVIPATEYYAIESVLVKGYIDYLLTPVI